MLINILNKITKKFGYVLEKNKTCGTEDIKKDIAFMNLYDKCKPYTMTSLERLYSLYQSVNYVLDNNISGDFVECGVWRGGSSMMMALILEKRKISNRKIFLYDTFEGMSEPTELDRSFAGEEAKNLLDNQNREDANSIWCYSSLEEVKRNLEITSFPTKSLIFVKGMVENTLDDVIPEMIAILRLDTDWYESTKKELEILYPLLQTKGVLIIDDFGHWEGAKRAVLEYFNNSSPLLNRIDNTGRIMVK